MPTRPSGAAPLAVALGLVLFSACTEAPDTPPAAQDDASGALVMGPGGVGRLGAETPFDTAAVRAALPAGFAIEVRTAETEAGRVPVVWALRDGLLVLEVHGDDGRVTRIDAASDQVGGPDGARTGQSFAEVEGGRMDCEPGERDLSGRVVCGRGPVRYVFATAASSDADDDELADALLERLVWTAD